MSDPAAGHVSRRGRLLGFLALGVALLGAGFVYGYLSHRDGLFPASLIRAWVGERRAPDPVEGPRGRWNRLDDAAAPGDVEALRAIGYLSGSDAAPEVTGIMLNDPDAAWSGLNLYTSGHAPEAILMDMDGEVLHRWSYEFADVWPPESFDDRPGYFEVDYWRRVHLLDNGDLLAIYEGFGIVRLDRDSNLLWSYPRADASSLLDEPGAHHDLHVDEQGRIHVLTRYARVVPRINATDPILEDYITVLSPDGEVVDSFSLLEAFERSPFKTLLRRMVARGDVFHTNTIEIFDGSQANRGSIFQRGNALISLRELNVIAIVDTAAREVVWAITGLARAQHQPTLLETGNMLLFDNYFGDRASRVIEFDPLTQQIVWSYPAGGADDAAGADDAGGTIGAGGADSARGTAFFSATCGSNQRLANGNTLITETDRGRAFEVDAGGEIVWEFLNPQRAGDDGELIASLFEVIRVPRDYVDGWMSDVAAQ